jgi:hypothetical protein
MSDVRFVAVDAYVQAIRTGEASSAAWAASHLAPDVVLMAGPNEYRGHSVVLDRISGQWPVTNVLMQGVWADPVQEADRILVSAEFPGMGAAPAAVKLAFSFAADGRISRIEQETVPASVAVISTIPDYVKSMVNNALKNSTVMTVSYVDEQGIPSLSLRGSVQAFSDTELSLWIRSASGGLASVAANNGWVALMYRDSHVRATLSFLGRARLETSEEVRQLVFERIPEVEQRHDLARKGAAVIVDVRKLVGSTGRGAIRLERPEN